VGDLPPRQSQDVPARESEVEVPLPVRVEGERVAVRGAAVRLDDEPLGGPMEVDLMSLDEPVHDRRRQAGLAEEVE